MINNKNDIAEYQMMIITLNVVSIGARISCSNMVVTHQCIHSIKNCFSSLFPLSHTQSRKLNTKTKFFVPFASHYLIFKSKGENFLNKNYFMMRDLLKMRKHMGNRLKWAISRWKFHLAEQVFCNQFWQFSNVWLEKLTWIFIEQKPSNLHTSRWYCIPVMCSLIY